MFRAVKADCSLIIIDNSFSVIRFDASLQLTYLLDTVFRVMCWRLHFRRPSTGGRIEVTSSPSPATLHCSVPHPPRYKTGSPTVDGVDKKSLAACRVHHTLTTI